MPCRTLNLLYYFKVRVFGSLMPSSGRHDRRTKDPNSATLIEDILASVLNGTYESFNDAVRITRMRIKNNS